MTSFAERMGYKETRTIIQRESLDDETRIDLWNVLAYLQDALDQRDLAYDQTENNMLNSIWADTFKEPFDEREHNSTIWEMVKESILHDDNWYDALDTIEEVIKAFDRFKTAATDPYFIPTVNGLNDKFERNLVAFRFIGTAIIPVDSVAEVNAIENALEETDHFSGARHSLTRAIDLLADRSQPDYPNSIKESISAVEAITKMITGKGTLGEGLKNLEASGLKIHPALKDAWLKMYGWTSDADGIRHAGIEAADANQALAKYALVSSSAFISYLLDEGQKAGLLNNEDSPA